MLNYIPPTAIGGPNINYRFDGQPTSALLGTGNATAKFAGPAGEEMNGAFTFGSDTTPLRYFGGFAVKK